MFSTAISSVYMTLFIEKSISVCEVWIKLSYEDGQVEKGSKILYRAMRDAVACCHGSAPAFIYPMLPL